MTRVGRLRQILLGCVLGLLVAPATARAQWTVYDPTNHATNIAHRIESATHWLQQLEDNIRHYETLVKQWTTMKDVLLNAEKLVTHNVTWAVTMASVGNAVRGVYTLKDQLFNLVRFRIVALKNITTRLRNGLFDPAADLEDLEAYLRDGLGRSSAARLATLERLASFDATLQTLYERWQRLNAEKAGLEKHLKDARSRLDEAVARGVAPATISDIKAEINAIEQQRLDINTQIDAAWAALVDRAKRYHVTIDDRQDFAASVAAMDAAWEAFFSIKQEYIRTLDDYGRRAGATRPRWVEPPGGTAIPLGHGN